jgi:hypothetical protein
MIDKIEAILASPPARNGLVVQLFVAGGGQFAEIFDDDGHLVMEFFTAPDSSIKVDCSQILRAIGVAETELIKKS